MEVLHLTCQTQLSTTLRDRRLRFSLVISLGPTAEWIIHVLIHPLSLDCHAIGNDLLVDRDELGSIPLNRTCGHSTSAWCQLGNGLRIVNGGNGQWKRLRSRMEHALDDDDMLLCLYCTIFNSSYGCHSPIKRIVWKRNATVAMVRSLCVFSACRSRAAISETEKEHPACVGHLSRKGSSLIVAAIFVTV